MRILSICLILGFFCAKLNAQKTTSVTFYFGKKNDSKKGININKPFQYSDSLGFGFDFGSQKYVKLTKNSVQAKEPVYFSVQVPEGNYLVDVVFGGDTITVSTLKAESRRLQVKELLVKENSAKAEKFIVNVRIPEISDTKKISLKDREIDYLNWDNKLTLEFLGNFAIKSITISPLQQKQTIFLAGDSTVADQDLEPWASWGQFLSHFVNDATVVANYAASGASLSSFKSRNRLEILTLLKKGDYLFIEFAHNDEKRTGIGIGPWQSYTNLLIEYVTKTREKGGIPILVTPTQRRLFYKNGRLNPTHGAYPDAMRMVAKDLKVPLIDITKMTTILYETWGVNNSKKAFVQYAANTFPGQTEELIDNTHFNNFGAYEIAKCVVQGMKELKSPISKLLKKDIDNYTPQNPAYFENWTLPISAKFEQLKPEGN